MLKKEVLRLNILLISIFILTINSCKYIDNQILRAKENSTEHIRNDTVWYKVKWVSDGDTFWIEDGSYKGQKIRLIGLDAPESVDYGDKLKQKFGEEAHDFADSLLKNQNVRLSYDLQKYDKYGRTLAYAYLQDGRFVNEILIKNGFAVAYNYAPNITYKEIFSHAEDSAKIKKLGLWRD